MGIVCLRFFTYVDDILGVFGDSKEMNAIYPTRLFAFPLRKSRRSWRQRRA